MYEGEMHTKSFLTFTGVRDIFQVFFPEYCLSSYFNREKYLGLP